MFKRKLTKKKYLKLKVDQIDRMIWDFEFARFQRQALREEIRQERERLVEIVAHNKKQVENEKDKDLKKKAETELENNSKKLEGLEQQIQLLDAEISGTNPQMEASYDAKIKEAHVLKETLKVYLDNIR